MKARVPSCLPSLVDAIGETPVADQAFAIKAAVDLRFVQVKFAAAHHVIAGIVQLLVHRWIDERIILVIRGRAAAVLVESGN